MQNTLKAIFILMVIAMPVDVSALSEDSHAVVNETILNYNFGLQYNNHFINNLLLDNGIHQIVNQDTVTDWIMNGGRWEDTPGGWCINYTRSMNHFHNPLTEAGWKGISNSAVLWAQMPAWTQATGLLSACGNYAWEDVRAYYHAALTSLDPQIREQFFSETFRGVGQLMHLVEDMSVPDHVRNDTHVLWTYEKWVLKNRTSIQPFLDNPVFPNASILMSPSAFPAAVVPVANLFDTNQYDGTNPSVTFQDNVGLSEYTNANFVSPDTKFIAEFPYPILSEMQEYNEPDGAEFKTYLRKIRQVDGQPVVHVEHFLEKKWFYLYRRSLPLGYYLQMNDNVHKDYAKELIPRAVGYSAEMMRYFFRGNLDVSSPMKQVYSVISGTDNAFRAVKAKVRNATPNEAMGPGTLQAILKYRKRTDFSPDLVNDPPSAASREATYSFSASALYPVDSVSSTVPMETTFDFSLDPVPIGITDLYLMVVYKGTIGLETGNAVAVGGRDLLEPAHHVIFNLTDMFLLNNQLKLASEIRSNPGYAAYVDLDHDGIFNEVGEGEPFIDPHNILVDIGYSYATGSVAEPAVPAQTVATAAIEPGKYIKLICLADNVTNTIIRFTQLPVVYPEANEKFFDVAEIVNQQFGSVWSASSQVFESRGIRNHFWQGGIVCNNPVGDGVCPAYPQNEAIPLTSTLPGPVTIFH